MKEKKEWQRKCTQTWFVQNSPLISPKYKHWLCQLKKNHQLYQIMHKIAIFCVKVSPCLWSKMFADLLLEKEGQERTFVKKGRI
jgi:hypothetical protein